MRTDFQASRRRSIACRRPASIGALALCAAATACGGSGAGPGGGAALALHGYSEPTATYEELVPIAPNVPTYQGAATSWSVTPALPSGLLLDAATGVLTGAASAPAPLATYTVTASNATESDQVALDIEVVAATATTLVLVSRAPDDTGPGDGPSGLAAPSADGRRVAFISDATNFSVLDDNGNLDGYLRDVGASTTEIVSATPTGKVGDGHVESIDTDASGHVVVFHSDSDNLPGAVPGTPNEVYVHDLVTGQLERISIGATAKATGPSDDAKIDGSGDSIVYRSGADDLVLGDHNDDADIFLHRRLLGTTERVSLTETGGESNGDSESPAISRDGTAVAFVSRATNLVAGDTNGCDDVFVRQNGTGAVQRVSVSELGDEGNDDSGIDRLALSADGRFVAFTSLADNLVPGDTNARPDVFVADRFTGEITRASMTSDGTQASAASSAPDLSGDGRHVVFVSLDDALAPDDTDGFADVFQHDRQTGATVCVSRGPNGEACTFHCSSPAISTDGSVTLFGSAYAGLFPGLNQTPQVWARVPVAAATSASPARDAVTLAPAWDVFQVVAASRTAPFEVRRRWSRGVDEPGTAREWRARTDAHWLRLEPAAGAPEADAELVLRFETAGLAVSRYRTEVVLEDAAGVELARCNVLLRVIE